MWHASTSRMQKRLNGWDYASNGAYFITVCTAARRPLLGALHGDVVVSSTIGRIALEQLRILGDSTRGIDVGAHVLMPDHIHVILMLTGQCRGRAPLEASVASWKASVTREARQRAVSAPAALLWQRGFYDRVIRNEREFDALSEYIDTNPLRLALATAAKGWLDRLRVPGDAAAGDDIQEP